MPINAFGDVTIITIEKSNTISELVDIVNKNFDSIMLNGGGPRGYQGVVGERGLPGQSIIGDRGPTGSSGTIIHFTNFLISDGDIVNDVSHMEGGVVIDSSGVYYQVEDQSGTLRYAFRINFASLSLATYLVNGVDIASQGVNPISNHHYDSTAPTTNTLFIAARSPEDAANDKVAYKRLVLGGVPASLIENSPLTLVNVIPDASTVAADDPFSQLVIKHRIDKTSPVGLSSFKVIHNESPTETISDLQSGDLNIKMKNDLADSTNSGVTIKARNVILNGESDLDNPANRLLFEILSGSSKLESDRVVNLDVPISTNKAIVVPGVDVTLNNSTSFSIPTTLLSNPSISMSVSIPSNRAVGRLSTISGGTENQVLIIKNVDTNVRGVIIDDSGNISCNRPIINLRQNQFIILKFKSGQWYQIASSIDDYQITYVSATDITKDYNNLINDGIYMVYKEAAADYLNGVLDSQTAQQQGGGGASPDLILNSSSGSIDGYGVITHVNKTYNDIIAQRQVNGVNGEIWERIREHDGTWNVWKKVIKVDGNQGSWLSHSTASSNYVEITPTSHHAIYRKFDKICNFKLHVEGTSVGDNPAKIVISLPAISVNVGLAVFTRSPCTLVINENDANPANVKMLPATVKTLQNTLEIYYKGGSILTGDEVRITMDISIPVSS